MIDHNSKVGIYGGSFDPPHAVHVMIASYALSCMGLDHILILPCADHPFGKKMTPFDLRMQMTKIAFSFMGESVEVSDMERSLPTPSYTINTVKALKNRYSDVYFVLLIGSDNAKDIDSWHKADELKRLIDIHVLARGGEGNIVFPPVSSTMIRERVCQGLDIAGLVPVGVAGFIREYGLYRGGL